MLQQLRQQDVTSVFILYAPEGLSSLLHGYPWWRSMTSLSLWAWVYLWRSSSSLLPSIQWSRRMNLYQQAEQVKNP